MRLARYHGGMPSIEHVDRDRYDAVLFDTDGVITDTASAHAAAWKLLFDAWLEEHAARAGEEYRPFDANAEYRQYVDGKPRYDGVRSFLESRGIALPFGAPDDTPDQETVCGLGNRKDAHFNEWLENNRVRVFPGTLEFIRKLRGAGILVAAFSASRNMKKVLDNAGIAELFDAQVDGCLMAELGLPGKPDPAILQTAADLLDVPIGRCLIVEDAIAGVDAAHSGGAAVAIGIDRAGSGVTLIEHGADLVVDDLSECRVDASGHIQRKRVGDLESAWQRKDELHALLRERRAAVLLDYDGTLTPIVTDYRKAFLSGAMRDTLDTLSQRCTVGVISGRDLADVRQLVGLDTVFYSGSHGFELSGPNEWHHVQEHARAFLPDLDRSEAALREALADIEGHAVERKRFSIAAHYRQVPGDRVPEVEAVIDRVLANSPALQKGLGKKVFELKPAIAWDKGRAVELLLDRLGMHADDSLAVYVGDDVTDEAVFRVLRHPNLSIVLDEGNRLTSADHTLADCDDVKRFLDWLAESATGTGR